MSKEPTRHQLSSRLAYNARTPAFLQRLQARMNGGDDEDDEYEYDGSGRPPIPKRPPIPDRPAIPERPDDDPGSAGEDDQEERPQVVVLKEGKHLSEREVENEKRKAKGLPPLPDTEEDPIEDMSPDAAEAKNSAEKQAQSLYFGSTVPRAKSAKRKAIGDARNNDPSDARNTKKKLKKAEKKLLSFGDES